MYVTRYIYNRSYILRRTCETNIFSSSYVYTSQGLIHNSNRIYILYFHFRQEFLLFNEHINFSCKRISYIVLTLLWLLSYAVWLYLPAIWKPRWIVLYMFCCHATNNFTETTHSYFKNSTLTVFNDCTSAFQYWCFVHSFNQMITSNKTSNVN